MDNTTRLARLREKDYQKIFGVTKPIFEEMLEILEETYQQEHRLGGHPSRLNVLDKFVIMLCYYRDYRTKYIKYLKKKQALHLLMIIYLILV